MKNTLQREWIFLLSLGLSVAELSLNVIPTHYTLHLSVNSIERTLQGRVCIDITLKTDVNEIKIHAKEKHGIRIRKIEIEQIMKDGQGPKISVTTWENPDENDELILHTHSLDKNNQYKMCLSYKGEINEKYGYIIWESQEDSKSEYIIATNFIRQGAFPCFDEPYLKSTFEIFIRLEMDEICYSNTPHHRLEKKDDHRYFVFIQNAKVAPSQISFVVTNIRQDDQEFYEYSFSFLQWRPSFWYRKAVKNELDLEKRLLNRGVTKSLGFMGPWFSFPWVTIMVIPTDKQILYTKWGLCLIRERTITEAGHGEITDDAIYTMFLGLSSQWIGGMVSPDSWDSNWMFQALASYIAYLQIGLKPFMYDVPTILWQEQPLSLDYTIKNAIDPFLDKTVGESKGLMLLRMIHHAMGKSAFVNAIDDFIKKYQFSSVGLDGLYKAFDGRSSVLLSESILPKGLTWAKVMETWNKKGYPLVSVQYGSKSLKISQEPIVEESNEDIQPNGQTSKNCWYFPITYTLSHQQNFKAQRASRSDWLGCEQTEIIINTNKVGWIIVNLNYIGLYRVKYDENSLKPLIKSLEDNPNLIPDRIRAQLVMDSLTVAWLGKQSYELTCILLQYLKQEYDTIVWRVFFIAATSLKEILENTDMYDDFKVFLNSFLPEAFELYYKKNKRFIDDSGQKIEPNTVSPFDLKFHYWACVLGSSLNCKLKMLKKYGDWIDRSDEPGVRSTRNEKAFQSLAICVGLAERSNLDLEKMLPDMSNWNQRLDFYIESLQNGGLSSKVRGDLIDAFSCVNDETTLNRLLEWSTKSNDIEAEIGEKERGLLELIKGVYSYSPTLNYFIKNIVAIKSFYQSSDTLALLLYNLTSRIKNEDLLKKMKEFVENTHELNDEKILIEFKRGEALSEKKIKWLKNNQRNLKSAFFTINKLKTTI